MSTTNLSTDLLRQLALMQHLGNEYFFVNGIAYEGNEKEATNNFGNWLQSEVFTGHEEKKDFSDWCHDNLTEIEPFDTDSYDNDYYVLTDNEADEKAKEYIKDSLWAFNPSFLADQTELPIEVFEAIAANNKCEGNNEAIESIIEKTTDIDSFVEAAIRADGRGHFLSSYDGNENEETVVLPDSIDYKILEECDIDSETTFYIYRIN